MLLVLLDQLLGLQCHVFRLDEKRFGFGISQVCQGHQTFLLPSAQHQPSRRVREEEGSTAEDDGGDQLQSQGDPPGCLSSDKVCTVRDPDETENSTLAESFRRWMERTSSPITDQDTERDGQLLQRDKRSSNTGRRKLSVVLHACRKIEQHRHMTKTTFRSGLTMGTNIDKAPTAIPPIHRPAQMKSMLSFAPT